MTWVPIPSHGITSYVIGFLARLRHTLAARRREIINKVFRTQGTRSQL
jgi:hypothetical protein